MSKKQKDKKQPNQDTKTEEPEAGKLYTSISLLVLKPLEIINEF